MTRLEELNILKEAKENEAKSIYQELCDLRDKYMEKMNTVLHENSPYLNDWSVRSFSEENMRIGFVCDKWKDGTDRYQEVDFYYQNHYGNTEKYIEINTSCFDSFKVEVENVCTTYFKGVGVLCSNLVLTSMIRKTWDEFLEEYKPIAARRNKNYNERHNIDCEIAETEEAIKDSFLYAEQDKVLAENPDGYIVIRVGETYEKQKRYTYRKRPAYWTNINVYNTEWEAAAEERRQKKNYGKYKAIPIKLLKIA